MALVLNQTFVSTAIITAVIIGSCIALFSIFPILLTGVYIYLGDIWREMIKDRKKYLEWDGLRKVWNKKAAIEIRRRLIMTLVLQDVVEDRGLSQEDFWRYRSMVRVL
jgi:hypothetical protein